MHGVLTLAVIKEETSSVLCLTLRIFKMEKTYLIDIFNKLLLPFGFKKSRGLKWILKGKEITEVIFLQKSMYSEKYYFHYDYIINALHGVDSNTHTTTNAISKKQKYDEFCKLLDLENNMSDEDRERELRSILKDTIQEISGVVKTEKQLKDLVTSRGWCELLSVKDYLSKIE